MTSKIYKSAQGKSIDLGTIMLQNEHVRAVGNMHVNARGDKLDSLNRVIETKPRQIQKQNSRTTNVSDAKVHSSITQAKKNKTQPSVAQPLPPETNPQTEMPQTVLTSPPEQTEVVDTNFPTGGLAAAIARSRQVKQELEKLPKQQKTEGLRKI